MITIKFDTKRYEKIKVDAQKFWDGTLDRPIIQIHLCGKDPGRNIPIRSSSELQMFFDKSISCSEIIDAIDYYLSGFLFIGDGFPYFRPLLASSAMAVYINCNYVVGDNTIWFEPDRNIDLSKTEINYDPENIWFQRTKQIYIEAGKAWHGSVQLTMTNLGGIYDILAMIIPSEMIVYAMIDQPEEIKRLMWQAHDVWWKYYEDLSNVILPNAIGYMDFWLPIPCQMPSFLLQCDFCSLLNEQLFDEFVKPELAESCRRMGGALFHLDGPGAIRHLDSLLSIDELKVIQWVPGDGQKDVTEWPDLYRKVHDSGKKLMVTGAGTRENFDKVVEQLGSSDGLCYSVWGDVHQKDEFQSWLKNYGVAEHQIILETV